MEAALLGECPTALLMAHPGHELLVHAWMVEHRPTVMVLMKDDGASGAAEFEATREVVYEARASFGSICGRMTEAGLRAALWQHNFSLFHALTTDVAAELVRLRIRHVVTDAAEGVCVTHDVWRGVVNAAVEIASTYIEQPIVVSEISLGNDNRAEAPHDIVCRLTDEQWEAKQRAAAHYSVTPPEFAQSLERSGGRIERLTTGAARRLVLHDGDPRPHYESEGQRQVAAGKLPRVTRFRDHVAPLMRSLAQLRAVA